MAATDGPSWADQWGAGGIGAMGDDNKSKKDPENEKKTASSNGLGKAKAAAMAGAQKVKNGTSMGLKWVKNKLQKKPSSTSDACIVKSIKNLSAMMGVLSSPDKGTQHHHALE